MFRFWRGITVTGGSIVEAFQRKQDTRVLLPIFSGECGETFRDNSGFEAALFVFVNRLGSFKPRMYVIGKLSMKGIGEKYSDQYFSALT